MVLILLSVIYIRTRVLHLHCLAKRCLFTRFSLLWVFCPHSFCIIMLLISFHLEKWRYWTWTHFPFLIGYKRKWKLKWSPYLMTIKAKLKNVYFLDIYPIRNGGGERKKNWTKTNRIQHFLGTQKLFPLSLLPCVFFATFHFAT